MPARNSPFESCPAAARLPAPCRPWRGVHVQQLVNEARGAYPGSEHAPRTREKPPPSTCAAPAAAPAQGGPHCRLRHVSTLSILGSVVSCLPLRRSLLISLPHLPLPPPRLPGSAAGP